MINIPGNKHVLADSDALIGFIYETDALHTRCLKVAKFLAKHKFVIIIPYPIALEAATTLAKDKTIKRPDLAAQLLNDYVEISAFELHTPKVTARLAKLYHPKTSVKNTPFDYYLLALAQIHSISYIFSFDTFYRKHGLLLAEELLDG